MSISSIKRGQDLAPTRADLEWVFRLKHGDPATTGWSPRMRFRSGYFTPDDVYEATVANLITEGCSWVDVGCGRDVLPNNRKLAQALAARCGILLGVDPDETLDENPFVHRRVRSKIDDFREERTFGIVTLRMVAEHISDPVAAVASLARITEVGGRVVVYTINRWSPISILAKILPFGLHHPIKRLLWKTEERDTFPVVYRMNTRRRLARLFLEGGFTEVQFNYLDDCRTFGRYRFLCFVELTFWKLLKTFGVRYPENCLLGIYERVEGHQVASAIRPGDRP